MALGDGGTGDLALGGAAVMRRVFRRTPVLPRLAPVFRWAPMLLRLAPVLLVSLGGCSLTGQLVAAGAGGASAAATANPAVGIAVGVGINAGINATFAYVARVRQAAEQNAIASEVGRMRVGERRRWRIDHLIPIGDEHGEVEVTEVIPNALTTCKGVAFSVNAGKGKALTRHWYTTFACRDGKHWRWALAEPATARWDVLQ